MSPRRRRPPVGTRPRPIRARRQPRRRHRLTVSATELRFHESIGTVRQAAVTGLDSVTVEADYQGEGESWRSIRELRLSDGGATLTVSGDGTKLVRVRCPAAAR
jgi:hypothetical protein